MNAVTPLLFEPIGREKLWGGAYLARTMRKPFALDAKIGESWEVSDYPGAETRVANGPSAGTSLRRLVEERLEEIVGDEAVLQDGRFPLLVKYIDAKETGIANVEKTTGLKLDQLARQFWTSMAISNRGASGGPINSDKRYNFLPTTSDPFTKRQRGCDLHAAFHGSKLTGPKLQAVSKADGMLRPGGAEMFSVSAKSGSAYVAFTISAPTAAKARARLIRIK